MVIRCSKCRKSDELVYFHDGSIFCERCEITMYGKEKSKTKKQRRIEREKQEGVKVE